VLPLIHVVQKKNNTLIGMLSHCLLHAIDWVVGLAFIAKM